jgi:protein SCO1/2
MNAVRTLPTLRRPRRPAAIPALLCAACALLVAAAVRPAAARADGDPASAYLAIQPVFVPAGTSHAAELQLARVAEASARAGAPIRVAVIRSIYDLGPITLVWRKPRVYAPFLGGELAHRYHGLLLVEMPDGFGVYQQHGSVAAETRALAHVPIGAGTAGLIASAERAIAVLAAVRGHPLPPLRTILAGAPADAPAPAPANGSGGGTSPFVTGVVLGGGALLIALCWTYSLRRRPAAGQWVAVLRRAQPAAGSRPRRALLALVPVCLVAVAVAEFELSGSNPPRAAATPPGHRIAVNRVQWPAGSRPAPDFALRDQDGRPVSLRSARGHVTILAFLDPVCRDLCPFEASVLGRVARSFAGSARPELVAVSVNPWGNARSILRSDMREWNVGSGWRWAIGSRAQLERVWKAYGIGVNVSTLPVAGTPVHEVSHVAMIYVLDATGHERDAYLYPFSVRQVASAVRELDG